MRGQRETRDPWPTVAAFAGRNHGVIDRAQLRRIGVGDDTIDRWIAAKRLHPIHRGVYAVGHRRLSREGRYLAAVLACGDGAVLSHRAAAEMWGLLAPGSGQIDVTV